MSGIAFTVSLKADEIFLLSDGRSAAADGSYIKTDKCKILLFSNKLAMQWVGVSTAQLQSGIKNQIINDGTEHPEYAAAMISDYLNENADKELGNLLSENRVVVYVFGFDKGGEPAMVIIDNSDGEKLKPVENRFIPKKTRLQAGSSGHFIYNGEPRLDYNKVLIKKYWPLYKDMKAATLRAFEEVIRDAEKNGIPVGGQIFQKSLKNNK